MQPCPFYRDGDESGEWTLVDKSQIARIKEAVAKVESAEKDLAAARSAFRTTLSTLHSEGVPLTAIGRELGITRQRVAQIINEASG